MEGGTNRKYAQNILQKQLRGKLIKESHYESLRKKLVLISDELTLLDSWFNPVVFEIPI
jgi:hypothetical protein